MAGGRGPARPGSHATAGRDLDARRRPPSSSAMRANEDPGRRGDEGVCDVDAADLARGARPAAACDDRARLGIGTVVCGNAAACVAPPELTPRPRAHAVTQRRASDL